MHSIEVEPMGQLFAFLMVREKRGQSKSRSTRKKYRCFFYYIKINYSISKFYSITIDYN